MMGLRTGLSLYYDKLEELYPETPVIVLTNVSNQETLGRFTEGSLLRVAQKMEYPPFELVDLVSEIVKSVSD